jgi:hypothetical protein
MFSFCANFWCIKSHFLIKCHAVYNGTSKALTHNTEKYCNEWMYILFYKSPTNQNGLKCCLLYCLQLYYVHIDNDVNILMICRGVKLYNNWVKVKESKLQKVVIANSKKNTWWSCIINMSISNSACSSFRNNIHSVKVFGSKKTNKDRPRLSSSEGDEPTF